MGLLSQGLPLAWPATQAHGHVVRMNGIEQFLNVFHAAKDFKNQQLKWGDEVEYLLVKYDNSSRKAKLSLSAAHVLAQLQKEENSQPPGSSVPMLWRPEYAKWMIEGTPGVPYRYYAADLVNVERNMMLRRAQVAQLLAPDETVITLTAFPRLGCGVYTAPATPLFGPRARSLFVSDDVCNPHPRFPTLTQNIRHRRNAKVNIQLPLYLDHNTNPIQPLIPHDTDHRLLLKKSEELMRPYANPNDKSYISVEQAFNTTVDRVVAMDASAFGMGCCCLQVTIQGRDMEESRYLYDQLAVLAPLMLAVTAATPTVRGMLVDTDARWDIISAAMDDRTQHEISTGIVPKSRYSSIDCFISNRQQCKPHTYNDLPVPINRDAYDRLIQGGVDHLLAQHVAHLFIRDPLVIYNEDLNQDNTESIDHFENIQSTNWNTVRFKLPPPGTDIGWRTEFRSMEVGLTDFENAAFSVFIVILSRVILAFNLDFYVPMSKVDENMATAHQRDAVRSECFYFRKNVFKSSDGSGFLCGCGHIHNASLVGGQAECEDIENFVQKGDNSSSGSDSDSDPFALMTLDEIFNGKPLCKDGMQKGFAFPGLVPLMRGYVNALEIDCATRRRLLTYLEFVSQRASGVLCTNATYIRNFIRSHHAYKMDSVVSEEICFDLIKHLQGVTDGAIEALELLGHFHKESLRAEIETPDSMMKRMQQRWEGKQAGLLVGATMPKSVLRDTIVSIATLNNHARCKC